MSNDTNSLIDKIKNRYDAENDYPTQDNNPIVSCTEYDLLMIIEDLQERMAQLKRELTTAERQIRELIYSP